MALRRIEVETAIELFLEEKRSQMQSASTLQGYEITLRQARLILAKMKVHKVYLIEEHHARRLVFDQEIGWSAPVPGRSRSTGGLNNNIGKFRTFMKWCKDRRYIAENPMRNIKPLRHLPPKKHYLSYEDLYRILDQAHHPRDRALFAIAMFTALRVNEILTMRVGDVDFERGEIAAVLHKTKQRTWTPAYDELLEEIRTWLDFYESRVGPLAPDMYLIPAIARPKLNGRSPVQANEERALLPHTRFVGKFYALNTVLAEIGLDTKGQKYHMFRRSAGRLLYDRLCGQQGSQDRALRLVQGYFNHATRAITERYLGMEAEKEELAAHIKGHRFFPPTEPSAQTSNVVPFRKDKSA